MIRRAKRAIMATGGSLFNEMLMVIRLALAEGGVDVRQVDEAVAVLDAVHLGDGAVRKAPPNVIHSDVRGKPAHKELDVVL